MWPTPTPIPPGPTPEFMGSLNLEQFGQDFASGVVQGWNFFDSQTFAAVVWFILLALLIILGLMSIRRHLESL